MSKYRYACLISDTHYGEKRDSLKLLDHQKLFLDTVFFPELEKRGIKLVIHGGDLVHRRQTINFYTAQRLREDFLEKLADYDVHIIAGNHDVYHKNTNDVNNFNELLSGYPYINVHTKATEVHLREKGIVTDYQVLMLPWLNEENVSESMALVADTEATICIAHLDLVGFEMYRGVRSEHGNDPSDFKKFKGVYTGHYHHKSSRGNIHYLGAPWEMSWADYNDPRGFHILDLETGVLEFIQNPYSLYKMIAYDEDDFADPNALNEFDYSAFDNTYVKIVVKNRANAFLFDQFLERLEKRNINDVKVIDDGLLQISEDEADIDGAQDTLTILRNYMDNVGTSVDKPKLESLLHSLYNDALIGDE